jgi:opine dehydrogenase
MTIVAVMGAGAGGAAAAIDLALRKHRVRLWTRTRETLDAFRESGGVGYEGLFGDGRISLDALTLDLSEALSGADVVLVCLPAMGHHLAANALADIGVDVPIVLHPGHTAGPLEFREVFASRGLATPPVAALSTLAYVARKYAPDTVAVSGLAQSLRVACLPGGEKALAAATELYPIVKPERDVLATGLANVNVVLHPPGAILGAAWIEATAGDFLFYAEGVTPGVAKVIAALDRERIEVAAAFGHDLPPLHDEMAAIGTADRGAAARGDVLAAIRNGAANVSIRAPDSLAHRYYQEDLAYGLVPFVGFGRIADVSTPVASSLLHLGCILLGTDLYAAGLNAARLGLTGVTLKGLVELVRRRPRP